MSAHPTPKDQLGTISLQKLPQTVEGLQVALGEMHQRFVRAENELARGHAELKRAHAHKVALLEWDLRASNRMVVMLRKELRLATMHLLVVRALEIGEGQAKLVQRREARQRRKRLRAGTSGWPK